MKIILIILITLFLVLVVVFFLYHQRNLRRRAWLMREAIRNHDWTFKLSTKGLPSGERAMQEALNELGEVIRQQVSQGEVKSWERLMRVLTHEIMNSTAPIASISQSLLRRSDVQGTPIEAGIQSIHSTATRLTTFVDSYRKLSQLQKPVLKDVNLTTFFKEVEGLYPQLTWDIQLFGDTTVHADPVLLQQVVVNVVKNAVEADAKRISLIPYSEEKDVYTEGEGRFFFLLISNDGAPIPAEVRDTIFVPFFTTKHDGTGIGLSLSRQILARFGGRLELLEHPKTGYTTTFCLVLACS